MMIIDMPRQSGKTTLLINKLKENKNAIMLVPFDRSRIYLQEQYPELKERIKTCKMDALYGTKYDEILIDEIEFCFINLMNLRNRPFATTTNGDE